MPLLSVYPIRLSSLPHVEYDTPAFTRNRITCPLARAKNGRELCSVLQPHPEILLPISIARARDDIRDLERTLLPWATKQPTRGQSVYQLSLIWSEDRRRNNTIQLEREISAWVGKFKGQAKYYRSNGSGNGGDPNGYSISSLLDQEMLQL